MSRNIKYITFYDVENNSENREYYQSAKTKNNYICEVLVKNNYNVEIISPSWTKNKKGFYKKRSEKLKENINLKLFSTFGAGNRFLRIIKYLWSLMQLFIYLLFNIKKNEVIIVYHTPLVAIIMILLKKIKKFKLVLELEEKYQDVTKISKVLRLSENHIINKADAYIFSTEMFCNSIGKSKPFIICNGTYQVEKQIIDKFNDNRIHIVYAGIIDENKKGAFNAANLSQFLDEKYHIHILGFGREEDLKLLDNIIKKNNKKSNCMVTYDGFMNGVEYIKFIQKCHIGLSTQTIEGKYNDTSFPSKILVYLANGLRVVSVKIPAIEKSKIGDLMYFYKKDDLESIAQTIKSIDIYDSYNSRDKIRLLDEEFKKSLKKLLERDIIK